MKLRDHPHFLLELKEGRRPRYISCPCTCHPKVTGKERWSSTLRCDHDGKILVTPCAPHWLKLVEPADPEDFQIAREESYKPGMHLVRTRRSVTREVVLIQNHTFNFLVTYPNGRKRTVPINEIVHYEPIS